MYSWQRNQEWYGLAIIASELKAHECLKSLMYDFETELVLVAGRILAFRLIIALPVFTIPVLTFRSSLPSLIPWTSGAEWEAICTEKIVILLSGLSCSTQ